MLVIFKIFKVSLPGLVLALRVDKLTVMLLQFFFNQLPSNKQIEYLKKRGVLLGTRTKENRKVFVYMMTNLFVEVRYKNDNTDEQPEKLTTLNGLKNLNDYLEKEFRTSF